MKAPPPAAGAVAGPSAGTAGASCRVLGIDPGTRRTGWGVVERTGNQLRCVATDTILAGDRAPLPDRLRCIYVALRDAMETYAPDVVAVEDIFFAKHPNAALKLGHARGVALLAAAVGGLEVVAYPPARVKRTIVGRGRADKQQVARIVGAMLRLRDLPGPDATDALAVAITHAQASPLEARLR
ncbi:MAG: crossover junction endodeoxyribonuclease RuvC [Myxococcales bacterium]|nr:crossover junction endodeoxyribonuclease RuvC [Myxococcales bacterium]